MIHPAWQGWIVLGSATVDAVWGVGEIQQAPAWRSPPQPSPATTSATWWRPSAPVNQRTDPPSSAYRQPMLVRPHASRRRLAPPSARPQLRRPRRGCPVGSRLGPDRKRGARLGRWVPEPSSRWRDAKPPAGKANWRRNIGCCTRTDHTDQPHPGSRPRAVAGPAFLIPRPFSS